jgi:hypothetical protein
MHLRQRSTTLEYEHQMIPSSQIHHRQELPLKIRVRKCELKGELLFTK